MRTDLGAGRDFDAVHVYDLPRPATAFRANQGPFACALLDMAAVYCWGDNGRRLLGQGDNRVYDGPQRVLLP